MYTTVFEPLVPELGGRRRLILIVDDVLQIVPFQMLCTSDDPSSWLLKQYSISYAPSASALVALQRKPDEPRTMEFLGLAPVCDGDLPATKAEVTNIGAMFGDRATIRTGAQATKAELEALTPANYRFIHFATHGLCDVMDQNGSALVMHDESLYTHDIAGMSLNADLVVLSACETGLGVATHGEGLLGLTRAFLSAGAASVCATLWKVDDAATAALMQRFYEHLQVAGSPAAALRAAQLEFLAHPLWSDPEFWAAFIVTGRA